MATTAAAAGGSSIVTIARWLARVLRAVAAGALAGFVAGLVAGGAGSRVAMRIVALSAPGQRGELTDAEAVVGRITLEGTLFLCLFGAFIGLAGGVLLAATRTWFPWRARPGWQRGLAFGLLLLAVFGALLVNADNPDFVRFGSRTLNVLLFAALFPLYGLIAWPLADRLERRILRAPSGRPAVPRALAPFIGLLCLPPSAPFLLGVSIGAGIPLGIATLYLAAIVPLLAPRLPAAWHATRHTLLLALPPVLIGLAYTAGSLYDIFARG